MSESYLEQLFPKLRKAGLVESVRGAGGGYRLARSLESVSVGDILRAAEGDLIPVECVLTSDQGSAAGRIPALSNMFGRK